MKKLSAVGVGSLILFIIGCGLGRAQETADPFSRLGVSALSDNGVLALSGTNIYSLRFLTDNELSVLAGALGEVPTIPVTALPRNGMIGAYWSLQQPSMPPLPGEAIGANAWPLRQCQ